VIDVNNAWGEAMELFIQMNREPVLVLPEKLNDVVLEKQSRFLEDNPTTGRIQEYLDTCASERVCVMELWEEALGNSGEPSRFETNGLHQMMQSEITGWIRCDKRQRCGKYGKQTCYERVSEWVEPSQEELPFK
jgi:hypothetical protein